MFLVSDSDVRNACRTLFGPEAGIASAFLQAVPLDKLKSAFRKKAKETHPDRFFTSDSVIQRQKAVQFQAILDAYDTIRAYCEQRDRSAGRMHEPSRPQEHTDGSAERFFCGGVPPRALTFGSYLYYSGLVPYSVLIKALAWQRNQRPPVGAIARQWGWLSEQSMEAILAYRGHPRLFGERATHLGYLKTTQVNTLLSFQRIKQQKLGHYFVLHGHLTQSVLEQALQQQKRHNALIAMKQAS